MMNERIRELAEQATKHYPAIESSGEFWTFDKEKFAELIVRECLDKIGKNFVGAVGSHASAHNSAVLKCQNSIKEHFGVE